MLTIGFKTTPQAYCLDKLGRSSEINKWHDKVFEYTNESFDRASVNNILPFIIYEHNGDKEKAGVLLNKLKTSPTSTRPLQRWVIAAAEKDKSTLSALSNELSENKYVDIMRRILSL